MSLYMNVPEQKAKRRSYSFDPSTTTALVILSLLLMSLMSPLVAGRKRLLLLPNVDPVEIVGKCTR